jgi:3-deoxy-manno-octulosonate cytidylyltransferase (CMP-KDO synthetase)
MKIAAVIPARYNSARFRGKPLVKIKGISMIERVYLQVKKSGRFSHIIVATDDQRILNEVHRFGGQAILTSEAHCSGTDRLWEVLEKSDFDAAVNIQGDEPAAPEKLIADLFDELATGKHKVVTAAYFNTSKEDFLSENVVKVVFDKYFNALYFSRSPLPYTKDKDFKGFFQHIGIYGYLKSALESFVAFPGSRLEEKEKLEQLRFLENGIPIKIIETEEKSYGVDVPEDVKKIENLLNKEIKNG